MGCAVVHHLTLKEAMEMSNLDDESGRYTYECFFGVGTIGD